MENNKDNLVKLAINGGVGFGAKLSAKQLLVIAEHMSNDTELELTTFQQLYMEIPESQLGQVIEKLREVDLSFYPMGNYVKSLRTCNFCKGVEEEGMPVAIELVILFDVIGMSTHDDFLYERYGWPQASSFTFKRYRTKNVQTRIRK